MPAPKKVLESARRVLMQNSSLLSVMEGLNMHDIYSRKCSVVGSSIGGHVRHSLDHYNSLVDALLQGKPGIENSIPLVEYDTRLRGGSVEIDMGDAIEALLDCSSKMGKVDEAILDQSLQVRFNLDGNEQSAHTFESNGLRELWFVAHHCIHHQAMVKLVVSCCPEEKVTQALPKDFGLAPSTIIYNHCEHDDKETSSPAAN